MNPQETAWVETALQNGERFPQQIFPFPYVQLCVVALRFDPVDIVDRHEGYLLAHAHSELLERTWSRSRRIGVSLEKPTQALLVRSRLRPSQHPARMPQRRIEA